MLNQNITSKQNITNVTNITSKLEDDIEDLQRDIKTAQQRLKTAEGVFDNKLDKIKSELNIKFSDRYDRLDQEFNTVVKLEQQMITEQVENTRKISEWCQEFNNDMTKTKKDLIDIGERYTDLFGKAYNIDNKVDNLKLIFFEYTALPWYKKITEKQRKKYILELFDRFK